MKYNVFYEDQSCFDSEGTTNTECPSYMFIYTGFEQNAPHALLKVAELNRSKCTDILFQFIWHWSRNKSFAISKIEKVPRDIRRA